MPVQRNKFQNAVWPESLPDPKEEHILTLLCGNTHVNWSLHMGARHKFAAKLHWRTPAFTKDSNAGADPFEVLANFTPQPVQDIFFGEHRDVENHGDNNKNEKPAVTSSAMIASPASMTGTSASNSIIFTAQDVAAAAAQRSVATLTVYVVSSNPEHEQGIEFLFSKIPVRLVRLQATDFYVAAQGLYPGMGVDRVATLKAAAAHYGYPALVLDGGTAMTYTAADCQGNVVGGGILPGLRVKLASLHDYTGSLPLITCQQLLATVQQCSEQTKETLPVFGRDTETAMLSGVLKETAVNLKAIIQAFVRQMTPDLPAPRNGGDGKDDDGDDNSDDTSGDDNDATSKSRVNRDFCICLTGGDHPIMDALLTTNHRHVVQQDPVNPTDLDFHVVPHKHLGTTGMQRVIWEKYRTHHSDALDAMDEEDVLSSAKSVSAEVVPAADAAAVTEPAAESVVKPPAPAPVAGSITAEKDAPGSGAKRVLGAVEKDVSVPEPKAKKAKVAVPPPPPPKAKVVKPKVTPKVKAVKPPPPKPKASSSPTIVVAEKVPPKSAQRSIKQDDDEAEEAEVVVKAEASKGTGKQDKYLNRRVAKHFGKDLYFGVVDEFYCPDGWDLWHVTYDDGDQEDFELDELIPALEEYRKNKNSDPETKK